MRRLICIGGKHDDKVAVLTFPTYTNVSGIEHRRRVKIAYDVYLIESMYLADGSWTNYLRHESLSVSEATHRLMFKLMDGKRKVNGRVMESE